MKRWVVILIVALIAYFVWRKFGGKITSTITGIVG